MTNTELLNKAIKDAVIKIYAVMDALGIKSYTTMRDKINNVKNFTVREIEILCVLLHLSVEQRERIFFADETELNSVEQGA